jgi:hypothetical protein
MAEIGSVFIDKSTPELCGHAFVALEQRFNQKHIPSEFRHQKIADETKREWNRSVKSKGVTNKDSALVEDLSEQEKDETTPRRQLERTQKQNPVENSLILTSKQVNTIVDKVVSAVGNLVPKSDLSQEPPSQKTAKRRKASVSPSVPVESAPNVNPFFLTQVGSADWNKIDFMVQFMSTLGVQLQHSKEETRMEKEKNLVLTTEQRVRQEVHQEIQQQRLQSHKILMPASKKRKLGALGHTH